MTISKSKHNYDVSKDLPPPKTVCVGVSLVTREVHHIIQDDRHLEIPCEDAITYITVNRDEIEVPNNSCIKYDVVADILDTNGFPKKMWRICHIWIPIPPEQEPF